MLLRAALAAVIVALAGCGGGDDPSSPVDAAARVSRPIVAGQGAVVLTPSKPSGKLVIYTHGHGEKADAVTADPLKAPLVEALLRKGYTVAASDAHGDNWGNPASVRDYLALARSVPHKSVYLLAQSAGGLDAMQLVDRLRPARFAAIYPACDVSSIPSYKTEIAAAYNGQPPSGPVRVTDARGVGVLFWASPDDTVVPKARNADVCARALRQAGGTVEVVTTTGDHGDPSNFDAGRLLDFFD